MPTVATVIGGAGTGKTTHLLDLMGKVLDTGLSPFEVGFISFTRAARAEAAERAASRFDVAPEQLTKVGWFKTLHAVCYQRLKAGKELLTSSKESRDWLRDNLQADVSGTGEKPEPEEISAPGEEATDADVALSLWHVARNRLMPFAKVWELASFCNDDTPPLKDCESMIGQYEFAKREGGRLDFTDLLSRFAGWRFDLTGPVECTPDGELTLVPVWFLDEAQDNSPLTDAVARRLTSDAKWVYLCGDPFQSIFGFSGADPHLFTQWPYAKRRVLQQSYRCPAEIMALGEACLRDCSDYWDRGIAPAPHSGDIDRTAFNSDWQSDVSPAESWLLLARTNYHAGRIGRRLTDRGIPWVYTRGGGVWDAPVRNAAIEGLYWLQRGEKIKAEEWRAVTKQLPAKTDGKELLERGTKTKWEKLDPALAEECRTLADISVWGATPELVGRIKGGAWTTLIDKATDYLGAVGTWGWDAVKNPKTRVGTVHSAKGMEGDNVFVLTSTSYRVQRSRESTSGEDEEQRLAYVAVTRARKRLIVADEWTRFKMEIPC